MRLLKRRGSRAGVTFVDMMAVTGILATMAGQSGSVYLQAKNKALGSQCQQQLQQIYQAIQMFADSNDGSLPMAKFFPWTPNPGNEQFPWTYHPADPYSLVNVVAGRDTTVRALFVCPAGPEVWKNIGITYVYNDTLRGRLLDSVPNPSATWLMMDAHVVSLRGTASIPPPHVNTYNVLFCDGRVKALPAGQVWAVLQSSLTPPAQGQGQAQGDEWE